MGQPPTWGAVATDVHWREWDGAFVVYHESSGNTHLLNPLGAAVIRILAAGPLGTSALLNRVGEGLPDADVAELPRLLPPLLDHLRGLGLIDRLTNGDAGHAGST